MKNWKKHEGSMPTLTKEDKIVCEALSLYGSEIYIARDKTNLLLVYFSKPVKSEEDEWWSCNNEDMQSLVIKDKFFKFITWDDEEPWLLADLLKLEVEEDRQGETIHWIPFKLDENGCLDCPYPDDGEDILISDGKTVWMDNFNDNDDGCFLYHSFRKLKDFEGLAWAKLPKPHKKEIKNESEAWEQEISPKTIAQLKEALYTIKECCEFVGGYCEDCMLSLNGYDCQFSRGDKPAYWDVKPKISIKEHI